MDLKVVLNTIMRKNGWNQSNLATNYGVSRSQVTRWIAGEQMPNGKVMMALFADYNEILSKKPA